MHRIVLFLLAISLGLAGCSPAFNWREVRPGPGELRALLPCKPDQGSRHLSLAGQDVELEMLGCETGGALFALSHVDMGAENRVEVAQVQWQAAMLGNMQAGAPSIAGFAVKGSGQTFKPVRITAQGRRPDGGAVSAQGVWFARGAHLYHAVIYADKIRPEVTEAFFSGLEFQ